MNEIEGREERAKEFIRFLKELGVYTAFVKNITSMTEDGLHFNGTCAVRGCSLVTYLNDTNPSDYVSGSFCWGCTPQKHWYWSYINECWCRVVQYDENPDIDSIKHVLERKLEASQRL